MAFAAEVLERVLGEAFELVADRTLRRFQLLLERRNGLGYALGDDLVARANLGTVDVQHLAFTYAVHDLGPDVVDQRDAGGGHEQRSDVGIATRDRARRIDAGPGPRLHDLLSRDSVEVLVVDHRDVAGLEASSEPLRARVDARRPDHRRVGTAVPALDGHQLPR